MSSVINILAWLVTQRSTTNIYLVTPLWFYKEMLTLLRQKFSISFWILLFYHNISYENYKHFQLVKKINILLWIICFKTNILTVFILLSITFFYDNENYFSKIQRKLYSNTLRPKAKRYENRESMHDTIFGCDRTIDGNICKVCYDHIKMIKKTIMVCVIGTIFCLDKMWKVYIWKRCFLKAPIILWLYIYDFLWLNEI